MGRGLHCLAHRSITIGETVLGRLLLPGHCTNSGGKHTFSLSVKEACCSGALARGEALGLS